MLSREGLILAEALFNTLRKYVHRGQKDYLGTYTTYALVSENHLDLTH